MATEGRKVMAAMLPYIQGSEIIFPNGNLNLDFLTIKALKRILRVSGPTIISKNQTRFVANHACGQITAWLATDTKVEDDSQIVQLDLAIETDVYLSEIADFYALPPAKFYVIFYDEQLQQDMLVYFAAFTPTFSVGFLPDFEAVTHLFFTNFQHRLICNCPPCEFVRHHFGLKAPLKLLH
jgi:hypothetical protein